MHTLYDARPVGVSSLLSIMDPHHGPKLYLIEPSGHAYGYFGCAIGKGKTIARTEIEKIKFSELSARDAVKEAVRMYVPTFALSKKLKFDVKVNIS